MGNSFNLFFIERNSEFTFSDLGLKTTRSKKEASNKSDAYIENSLKDWTCRSYDSPPETTQNCRENLSLDLNCREMKILPGPSGFQNLRHSATMNDLSGMQKSRFEYDERTNRAQYSPEKKYTKNIEYTEIDRVYEGERCPVTSSENSSEKLSNVNYYLSDDGKPHEFLYTRVNESKMDASSVSFTAETCMDGTEKLNLDIFNVSNADAGSDGTVSEAGTYTIHKDYTDEEKARMDIDKAFSVGVLTEREKGENYVHRFKVSSLSFFFFFFFFFFLFFFTSSRK